jgi:hypothetical protein
MAPDKQWQPAVSLGFKTMKKMMAHTKLNCHNCGRQWKKGSKHSEKWTWKSGFPSSSQKTHPNDYRRGRRTLL